MKSLWFESWESLLSILVSATIGYLLLTCYIRLAGKRATSKMNNFDWIVTVAVGSVYASMVLLKDVPVADGAVAMALLLGLQYVLTYATAHWEWARKVFLAPPSVLYMHGKFQDKELLKQRVSEGELLSAIREAGFCSIQDIHAVTLEPDANLSVINEADDGAVDTMESVPGYRKAQGA